MNEIDRESLTQYISQLQEIQPKLIEIAYRCTNKNCMSLLFQAGDSEIAFLINTLLEVKERLNDA